MIEKKLKNILRLIHKPFYYGYNTIGDKMIYALLILASIIWGINVLVMKVMIEQIPVFTLAFLKVGLSCISVYALLKVKGYKKCEIQRKEAFIIAIFSLTINFSLTFLAMKYVSGSRNAILNALAPAITIGLSSLMFHQKIEKNAWIAFVLSTIGFLISIQFQFNQLKIYHLILLVAMISYCFGNLLMQKYQVKDRLLYTYGYLLVGTLQLLLLTILFDRSSFFTILDVDFFLWILFILFSGVGFAFIQVVYLQSIQKIGSIKTSFFLGLNPMFTLLGSFLFLKEELKWHLLVAYVFLLLGLFYANKKNQNND